MSRLRNKSKSIATLVSALVVFAMWSNAFAGVFCPHMWGGDCCLMQKSHDHPAANVGSLAEMDHRRMHHEEMSDMDTDNSLEMSDMQNSDIEDSPQKPDISFADNEAVETTANDQLDTPNEPCSHCMMHSQSGANSPISMAAQSGPTDQVVPAASASILKCFSSSPTFVELHDHSPPGSHAPLYVLVSAFRI